MKTAELRTEATYALRESSYSATYPVMVLEQALWTKRDDWFTAEDCRTVQRRIILREKKGARAGRRDGYLYSRTGVPVLKLGVSDHRFLSSASPEHQIVDSAHDLLARALEKIPVMDLVDSGRSVVDEDDEGRKHYRLKTTVEARYADGETREVEVSLALVRPQALIDGWDSHLGQAEKEALAEAERERDMAELREASDKRAWNIRDRVTALLEDGDETRYNSRDERYDVHREQTSSGFSTTYQVSESVLLKLLALAEKGSAK